MPLLDTGLPVVNAILCAITHQQHAVIKLLAALLGREIPLMPKSLSKQTPKHGKPLRDMREALSDTNVGSKVAGFQ